MTLAAVWAVASLTRREGDLADISPLVPEAVGRRRTLLLLCRGGRQRRRAREEDAFALVISLVVKFAKVGKEKRSVSLREMKT